MFNCISISFLQLVRENFSDASLPSNAQGQYLSKIKEFLDDGDCLFICCNCLCAINKFDCF